MNPRHYVRILKNRLSLIMLALSEPERKSFECPICRYKGPFLDMAPSTGQRKHAKCPNCDALERHRLQFLVVNEILGAMDSSGLRMLHFAPEPFFREFFSSRFGQYETADLVMKGVDHHVDLCDLPFGNGTYDFVFASHVLEHIPNDRKAIAEIRRVLRTGGVAILPVPVVAERTVEYPEPNPNEFGHMRAPGLDYFERYAPCFAKVEMFSSESFAEKHQLFVYENRSNWPTAECPLRPATKGERHIDIVPVCYV